MKMTNDELRMGKYEGKLSETIKKYGWNFRRNTKAISEMYYLDSDNGSIDMFDVDNPTMPPGYRLPNNNNLLIYVKGFNEKFRKEIFELIEKESGIKTSEAPQNFLERVREERAKRANEILMELLMDF